MHGVFLNDLGAIMAANEVLTCHYQRYVNVPFSIYFIAVVIAMPENYPYDLQFQKKLAHIFLQLEAQEILETQFFLYKALKNASRYEPWRFSFLNFTSCVR